MDIKTILVLGGGVGGIVVANELNRKLSHQHRVVLVEKNSEHYFAPSFLWLMTGDREADKIKSPVKSLTRSGVEVIHAEAKQIDITAKTVHTSQGTISYDYLVLALGTEFVPESIPGLSDAAYSFYSFEEAKRLHETLKQFDGRKIALVVSSLPYKCPGAPHEAAMLIADFFKRRGVKDDIEINLYTPEPQPMPVAGPKLGDSVKQMLASKGITFNPVHKLLSVDDKNRKLFFHEKEPISYDLLIAIPPHRAPSVVSEAGLTNEAGWIPVDRSTLKTKFNNVYAIGDISSMLIPGRWNPEIPMMLPKAGVFAHAQAEVVAERISDEINGKTSSAEFCGYGYCMLEAGEGLAGFAYGNFFNQPAPNLELRTIGRAWHLGKVLFEQWWLSPFGIRKSILHLLLKIGAKIYKMPFKV